MARTDIPLSFENALLVQARDAICERDGFEGTNSEKGDHAIADIKAVVRRYIRRVLEAKAITELQIEEPDVT